MSSRSEKAAAMKDRLRQMSQGAVTTDGPLPGVDVERPTLPTPANGTSNAGEAVETPRASQAAAGPLPPPRLPPAAVAPPRSWRSQGITVYANDDERLERLAAFFKARGIKFGRRGQISLLAGAGIAALDQLLAVDPTTLLAIVEATMRERKGKSAAEGRLAN